MITDGTLSGSEGQIFYRRKEPSEDVTPSRIAIIVHGYAEHGGRYRHVAKHLAETGTVSYLPDHLGHGRSDGERALVADFEHVVDDLEAVTAVAESEFPGLPIVMIGHSMGGLLTARFVQRNPQRLAGAAFLGGRSRGLEVGPRGVGSSRTSYRRQRSKRYESGPRSLRRVRR